MDRRDFEFISLGRANVDLYSQDIGAPFEEISGFDVMVGGSPTNIAIGVSRLGHASAVMTAVGDDRCGDLVLRGLRREGVACSHVPRIAGKLTSLAMLGVQPPNDFPLSFYREDPADIHLTREHVDLVGLDGVGAVQVSACALARGSCADAARHLLEKARARSIVTYMDLDLRPSEWERPSQYGEMARDTLGYVDVLIGTQEEFAAALLPDPERFMAGHPVSADDESTLREAIAALSGSGPSMLCVKRGADGVELVARDTATTVPGFPVDVVNTVGAGDAFAAGLIASRLRGVAWDDAAQFANACGAIVVSRHGCSTAFPTRPEVEAFLESHGSREC